MLCKDFAYRGLVNYFEEISAIPRPSFHEERIADYLCAFAEERGLEYYRDEIHNVFIKLPASEGREGEDAVLLQGHTDMVCEKNSDVEHDFLNEGIKLLEKDGWLRADGTTLGADNGVAVAAMLYILDGAEGNLPSHPPIECLFTVSEEVGLEGATGFDYSRVSATRMINMDSADESEIIAGCAGGVRSTLSFTPAYIAAPTGAKTLTVSIGGLAGGHSGEDINKGRANANKLLGRILLSVSRDVDLALVSVSGGSKDNAIPREAVATVCTSDPEGFCAAVEKMAGVIRAELSHDDDGFSIALSQSEAAEKVMDADAQKKILFLLATVQNGIFEMNHNIAGLVEFSRNLGVIETKADGEVEFTFLARSPQASHTDSSLEQLESYAEMLGMKHTIVNSYPGWKYAEISPLREKYAECYKALFGKEPRVLTIHAGLECGIISEKLPALDIISCGPIVLDLHSPDEALNIASLERFFTVIKNVIKEI